MLATSYCTDYYRSDRMDMKFAFEVHELLPLLWHSTSVLDVGAGTGRLVKLLQNSGIRAVGVDSSATALLRASEANLPIYWGEAHDLPLRDSQVGTAASMHLLEHVEDPEIVVHESVRVAKDFAVHLVPLGEREDPTHLHTFQTIRELPYLPDRYLSEHERLDGKRFGIALYLK